MPLRQPLPSLRIPLRRGDPDAVLSLQPLIEAAYPNGGYDDLDYHEPLDPPLWAEHAAWAASMLEILAGATKSSL